MTRRPGFTMIELIIVVLIGAVLGTMAIPQVSRYASHRAASNARDAFIATAARARVAALQSGDEVRLVVSSVAGVTIVDRNGNEVAEPLDLRGATFALNQGFSVCYTPRGFARPGCALPRDSIVGFVSPQGRHTAWARVSPAGHVGRR